jgi:hypothetical protein
MADVIQIIANEDEVRDMTYSVTGQEYSQVKIQSALKYGSALVATKTGIYVWDDQNVWYNVAIQAANYLAASNLIPKTFRDPDTQKSYSMSLYESGLREISTINEGAVNEPGTSDAAGSEGYIKIISSPSKNYYRNRKSPPYKTKQGWTGEYNNYNPENYTLEKIG